MYLVHCPCGMKILICHELPKYKMLFPMSSRCKHCEKSYRYHISLWFHERSHTGEKSYVNNVEKAFCSHKSFQSYERFHRMIHNITPNNFWIKENFERQANKLLIKMDFWASVKLTKSFPWDLWVWAYPTCFLFPWPED